MFPKIPTFKAVNKVRVKKRNNDFQKKHELPFLKYSPSSIFLEDRFNFFSTTWITYNQKYNSHTTAIPWHSVTKKLKKQQCIKTNTEYELSFTTSLQILIYIKQSATAPTPATLAQLYQKSKHWFLFFKFQNWNFATNREQIQHSSANTLRF